MNKKIEIDLDFDRVNEKINSKEWKNLWFKISFHFQDDDL
jgi:hypothetical protein